MTIEFQLNGKHNDSLIADEIYWKLFFIRNVPFRVTVPMKMYFCIDLLQEMKSQMCDVVSV